jgi:hypothetical protein
MADTTSATTGRSRLVTGMFRDRESAERAYGSLTSRGYSNDDVNLLMSDETRKKHFTDDGRETELGTKAAEGAGKGAAIGGGIGATLAAIAAIGTSVALPGLGLVIGALIGAGIPEERVKAYEEGVKNGGIVMGVNARNDEDAEYFENDWKTNRGEHVYR